MATELRDLLTAGLDEEQAKVIVYDQFQQQIAAGGGLNAIDKSRSPGVAQSLYPRIDSEGNRQPGVIGVIRLIIADAQQKEGTVVPQRVMFTEEYPDFKNPRESIVFSVEKSVVGSVGRGPFSTSGGVRPPRPMLRQIADDDENPGYQLAVFGYLFDSIIRLTCFAQTNKEANARVEWLQRTMRNYEFYPAWAGVKHFAFWERQSDFVLEENKEKLYGRPLDFAVQHEEVKVLRQKTLERLIIRSGLALSTSELEDTL